MEMTTSMTTLCHNCTNHGIIIIVIIFLLTIYECVLITIKLAL